jgi:ankyrin repeat protein
MSKKSPWDLGLEPLAKAAEIGKIEEVAKLLGEGADPNTLDKVKRTPIYWAAQNGHIEVMKLLLEKGATINMGDNTGYSPLWIAAQHKQLPAVKLLLSSGADVNGNGNEIPLFIAISVGADEVALELLNAGADPKKKDINNETALTLTARHTRPVIFNALLERGADLYTLSFHNQGVLPEAAERACLDIVQMILARNPDKKKIQLDRATTEVDRIMDRLQVWGPAQDRLKKIQELLHAYNERKNGNKKSRKRSRKQRTRKLRKHTRKHV